MQGKNETETKENKPIRKKRKNKKYNFVKFLVFIAVMICGIVFLNSSFFNVTDFVISGNKFYTAGQIKEVAGISTGKNLVFETKLKPARNRLLEQPYIKIANLSKKFPGTVVIEVEERTEFASVKFGGEYIVVDREGLVLRSTDTDPCLPVLANLTVIDRTDGKALKVEQGYLLSSGLELLIKAQECDFYFERIDMDAVSCKAYIYYDHYYCEGSLEDMIDSINSIKVMVADQYKNKISHGVIWVGSNSYLSFAP